LIKLSGRCALVVVGSHGANRVVGALLGSVGQRVAAHATGTVVVVGTNGPLHSSQLGLLAGVSDSAGGRAALEFACAEAARRGSRITAVRAYGAFTSSRHSQLYGSLPELRAAEAAVLSQAVERMRTGYLELAIEARLIDQPPMEALARLARDAELLVLGCRHPASRWPSRLGPITATLLHHSPCPIAVVGRPEPAEPAGSESPAQSVRVPLERIPG
jgi:nucleotide-binding universal stress UspA family protein